MALPATREELRRALDEAHSPAQASALRREMAEATDHGVQNGGLPCCGTRGMWHLPWCYTGPWDPGTADL